VLYSTLSPKHKRSIVDAVMSATESTVVNLSTAMCISEDEVTNMTLADIDDMDLSIYDVNHVNKLRSLLTNFVFLQNEIER